jgi:hypothetical protein
MDIRVREHRSMFGNRTQEKRGWSGGIFRTRTVRVHVWIQEWKHTRKHMDTVKVYEYCRMEILGFLEEHPGGTRQLNFLQPL